MSSSSKDTAQALPVKDETASYLDMPAERRALAKAHVAILAGTARQVALDLPISADVDDFRRVLATRAQP